MRSTLTVAVGAALIAGLAACTLTQDVELELPPYAGQPVVEAYLVPGEPFGVLLTESADYFAPFNTDPEEFLADALVSDADAYVVLDGDTIALEERLYLSPVTGIASNYVSRRRVPVSSDDSVRLYVRLADGGEITGATMLLPEVPFDSIRVDFKENGLPSDTLAVIWSYVVDPDPTRVNRFRKIITEEPLTNRRIQDFTYTDEQLAEGDYIPTFTFDDFPAGDTFYLYNAHVDADYERFYLTTQAAYSSNGNPFAQPSRILGNVRGSAGALGIFTSYPYDVDTVIIPER